MLKLMRRQMEWLIVLAAVTTVLLHFSLVHYPRRYIFQLPMSQVLRDLGQVLAVSGLVWGLIVGLHDRLTSTRDFVRHRPISALRLFVGEHMANMLLQSLCYLIPLVLRRAFDSGRWSEMARIRGFEEEVHDDAHRLLCLLALMTIAWASYAIGVFTTRAPGGRVTKLLQGAVLALAWSFLSYSFLESHWRLSIFGFVIFQVGFAAVLQVLAASAELSGDDQDRALGAKTLAGQVLVVGLAAAFSLGILVTEIQSKETASLHGVLWPGLRVVDDEVILVTPQSRSRPQRVVDAAHQHDGVDQGALDRAPKVLPTSLTSSRSPLGGDYAGGRLNLNLGAEVVNVNGNRLDDHVMLWLDHDAGVLRSYPSTWISRLDARNDVDLRAQVFERPDGRRFSDRARAVEVHLPESQVATGLQALILDHADGTLWGVTTTIIHASESEEYRDFPQARGFVDSRKAPELVALELPEGERAVDFERDMVFREDRSKEHRYLILTERAAYKVKDLKLEKIELDWIRFQYDIEVTDADHLGPEVVVRDKEGQEVFRHRYGLYTAEEKWTAAKIIASSFLRAPLSLLASLAADDLRIFGFKEDRVVLDPLVAGGHRPWLAFAVLGFGALLAAGQDWRLRRMKVGRSTRLFWAVAILLGGPALMLLALLIERPRRHAVLPLVETKPLLLKSA